MEWNILVVGEILFKAEAEIFDRYLDIHMSSLEETLWLNT